MQIMRLIVIARHVLVSAALVSLTDAFSSPSSSLPPIKAAVIVPGFLTGKDEFQPLADSLTAYGVPSVVVPAPNWHWLPCIGGRSMRPMIERIDFTVRHLAANDGDITAIPKFDYTFLDCWNDFWTNPGGVGEVGGSAEVDEYPIVEPRGYFPPAAEPKGRVAIIGHSAGGWISRVYLSKRNYGGKLYGGSDFVHSIVTLGSPHANAPGAAFKGVEWCNREGLPDGVRGLAVAGAGFKGDSSGEFTQNCYAFCCNNGTDGTGYDGDGVTPVFSSLAFEGAEQMIVDDCTHFAWSDVFGGSFIAPDLTKHYKEGGSWYGTDGIIDKWAGWIAK